ncbi:MAG: hypothetical protein KF734_05925 [Saprospiraceae bacterium]|nr:hypothetical protein [Saprospiraceae bacterium]
MVKGNTYNEHIEQQLVTERECNAMLSVRNYKKCFEVLKEYASEYGSDESDKTLVSLMQLHQKIKEAKIRDEKEDVVNNLEFTLNVKIQDYLIALRPPDFSEYQKNSFRKKTSWNEEGNLISFFLFFKHRESANTIFKALLDEPEWIKKIKIQRFYREGSKKILLSDQFDPVDSQDYFDDDFEEDGETENNNSFETVNKNGIDYRIYQDVLKTNNAIRLEKRDTGGYLIAEAIVEKNSRKGQVWISTNGQPAAKCDFMNEIVELMKGFAPDSEDFAICIPQTTEFKARSEEASENFSINLKQPIGELKKQTSLKGGTRTITIFLASSSELRDDRERFEIFINRQNKELIKEGIFLNLEIWEDFIEAMSSTRLQDEYNKAIRESDVFISLFFTKVGKYTEEEFQTAFKQFQETQKPKVYTYFKRPETIPGDFLERSDDLNSLISFQKKLRELGHFESVYSNIEDLQLKFQNQLKKILPII